MTTDTPPSTTRRRTAIGGAVALIVLAILSLVLVQSGLLTPEQAKEVQDAGREIVSDVVQSVDGPQEGEEPESVPGATTEPETVDPGAPEVHDGR